MVGWPENMGIGEKDENILIKNGFEVDLEPFSGKVSKMVLLAGDLEPG